MSLAPTFSSRVVRGRPRELRGSRPSSRSSRGPRQAESGGHVTTAGVRGFAGREARPNPRRGAAPAVCNATASPSEDCGDTVKPHAAVSISVHAHLINGFGPTSNMSERHTGKEGHRNVSQARCDQPWHGLTPGRPPQHARHESSAFPKERRAKSVVCIECVQRSKNLTPGHRVSVHVCVYVCM